MQPTVADGAGVGKRGMVGIGQMLLVHVPAVEHRFHCYGCSEICSWLAAALDSALQGLYEQKLV